MTGKKTLRQLRTEISDILIQGGGYTTQRICSVLDEIAHSYGIVAADEAIQDYNLAPLEWPKRSVVK